MKRRTQMPGAGRIPKRPFTLKRSSVVGPNEETLLAELATHTGSDDEAASILRSVGRLGTDASIESYEMTPSKVPQGYREASPIVWMVRAVRG